MWLKVKKTLKIFDMLRRIKDDKVKDHVKKDKCG